MTTDEIDRILGSDDRLEPSSGFARSVMDGVRLSASEPASLPFPWGRFAAGLAACGVAAGSGTVLLLQNATTLLVLLAPLAGAAPELGWAALSVLLGLGATRLPRLLARL